MPNTAEIEQRQSSYNIRVVLESNALTTALEQYWAQREAQTQRLIESGQTGSAAADAEREWKRYCATGTGFLKKFVARGAKCLSGELNKYWKGNSKTVRDTHRNFEKEATAEILIPISTAPVRFVRISAASPSYEMRDSAGSDDFGGLEIGKAYIAVSWRRECLFVITPSHSFVTIRTFTSTTSDGTTWTTDEVLPKVFAETAKDFKSDLEALENRFAPLLKAWMATNLWMRETAKFDRIKKSADEWNRVYIPEAQKLEVLRGAELFEKNDSAAPRGLLLSGPSGVGKTLVATTLADTMGCTFQSLTPADIKQDQLGASGQRVREIWNHARMNQPSVIILDECEGVLGRRGAAETDVISEEIVRSFLAEWDGLDKRSRVWVIGTTNRRDLMDDAILSRFGWEVELKLPNQEDRKNILEREIKALDITADLPADIGPLTQGMSGRDLREVARSARASAYPAVPGAPDFHASINKIRRNRNTKVSNSATWESLVLDRETLDRLQLICSLLKNAEQWTAKGVSIPKSLLLAGPPGVGKTEIARTLANESGLSFLSATTADAKANFLGQSGNRIKLLFERAKASSPAILFLDELDVIAPDAILAGDQMTGEIVGQLRQEMDGIQEQDIHVFVVGATNYPERIDSAIASRFPDKIAIPLPNRDARIRHFVRLLKGKAVEFALEDGAILLASLSEDKGWSVRDIENSVRSAEQKALLRAIKSGTPENYALTLDDFDLEH